MKIELSEQEIKALIRSYLQTKVSALPPDVEVEFYYRDYCGEEFEILGELIAIVKTELDKEGGADDK